MFRCSCFYPYASDEELPERKKEQRASLREGAGGRGLLVPKAAAGVGLHPDLSKRVEQGARVRVRLPRHEGLRLRRLQLNYLTV